MTEDREKFRILRKCAFWLIDLQRQVIANPSKAHVFLEKCGDKFYLTEKMRDVRGMVVEQRFEAEINQDGVNSLVDKNFLQKLVRIPPLGKITSDLEEFKKALEQKYGPPMNGS
jgi:hypothetical protein